MSGVVHEHRFMTGSMPGSTTAYCESVGHGRHVVRISSSSIQRPVQTDQTQMRITIRRNKWQRDRRHHRPPQQS
jgi:hypothetical protein